MEYAFVQCSNPGSVRAAARLVPMRSSGKRHTRLRAIDSN
jgi:hypothetical protein